MSAMESIADAQVALGRRMPRLYTPPLVELNPQTSYGFRVIDFAANILGEPLDEWQEEAVIRGGELLPDGRPRFRTVLLLVSRQQGKTYLMRVLTSYWLFEEKRRLVFGLSSKRGDARDAWDLVRETAEEIPFLANQIAKVSTNNGREVLRTVDKCEYKIAASNRAGGRGQTIHRLIMDELREHKTWDAWNAAMPAMNAVRDAQAWLFTNQGDDRSIVLDSKREDALEFINTGVGDPRLGLLEWSAPDGADPEDLDALGMANPTLGGRTDIDVLLGPARAAKAKGGKELADFRTEYMCQRVHMLDPAIDPDRWDATKNDMPVDLALHRDKLVTCLDISLDGSHATLVAAAMIDGVVHAEVIKQWDGLGCSSAVRTDLPGLLGRVRPRVLAWFPSGPAAAIAADLQKNKARRTWPPKGTKLVELRAEEAAISCMELSEQVLTGDLRRPADAFLDMHVKSTTRLWRGDRWVFQRAGRAPIDGAYALAGALHQVRRLPKRTPLVAVTGTP